MALYKVQPGSCIFSWTGWHLSFVKIVCTAIPSITFGPWLAYHFLTVIWVCFSSLGPVMSEYHELDTKEYPNIFGCHIMYRMNIRIYSDETHLPNEYPNIFVLRK